MLYFKEELIYWVENEIKLKGNTDDLKAFNYFEEINYAFNNYYQPTTYNLACVQNLDSRIKKEYPLITDIERALSNQSVNVHQNNEADINNLPDHLNVLKIDAFGICYSVLLKKGMVSALKDFLK